MRNKCFLFTFVFILLFSLFLNSAEEEDEKTLNITASIPPSEKNIKLIVTVSYNAWGITKLSYVPADGYQIPRLAGNCLTMFERNIYDAATDRLFKSKQAQGNQSSKMSALPPDLIPPSHTGHDVNLAVQSGPSILVFENNKNQIPGGLPGFTILLPPPDNLNEQFIKPDSENSNPIVLPYIPDVRDSGLLQNSASFSMHWETQNPANSAVHIDPMPFMVDEYPNIIPHDNGLSTSDLLRMQNQQFLDNWRRSVNKPLIDPTQLKGNPFPTLLAAMIAAAGMIYGGGSTATSTASVVYYDSNISCDVDTNANTVSCEDGSQAQFEKDGDIILFKFTDHLN